MAETPKNLMRNALETMLAKFKDGEPKNVLFTTFNFSSSFFEANVLPLLAGNSVEELKGSGIVRKDLNATLNKIKTVVVCDRSAHPEPKGNLRYGLLPIGLTKGRFHPKIILMAGTLLSDKPGLWLSVGSGNLSLSGWAINREVVGITPVVEKHKEELLTLLKWLYDKADAIARLTAGDNKEDVSAIQEEGQTREVLQYLVTAIENVTHNNEKAKEYPDLHFALPLEVCSEKDKSKNFLLKALAGDGCWETVTIISPFWAYVPELLKALKSNTYRFVPSLQPEGKYAFPINTLNRKTADEGTYSFLYFKDSADRYTHAKALILERINECVLCIGSANFTTAAMWHKGGDLSNVEAMLRYSISNDNSYDGLFKKLDEGQIVQVDNHGNEEGAPQLPPFDADVMCDWKEKKFIFNFMLHRSMSIHTIKIEVAEKGCIEIASDTSENQRYERTFKKINFNGLRPVRNFSVQYVDENENQQRFEGIVTQYNAYDDDLNYSPRPQLSNVLDFLRSLDPNISNRDFDRRAARRGGGGGDDEGGQEPIFDFFIFFQAMYKLRKYYTKKAKLKKEPWDPFSKSSPYGIPVLYRAIILQPIETIGRYVQLSELLETVEYLENLSAENGYNEYFPQKTDLKQELEGLKKEIKAGFNTSKSFVEMFGIKTCNENTERFLTWFHDELKKEANV